MPSMRMSRTPSIWSKGAVIACALSGCALSGRVALAQAIAPANLPRIGTLDERFQSYNIEMVEITGGRFWRPYRRSAFRALKRSARTPSDPYAYRPPIDLANQLLRRLALALSPAYLRVSGTWANATAYSDSDEAALSPPAGFDGVVTRSQWRGVIDFAQAVNARIMTSFAVSPGSREAGGVWRPDQARRLVDATRAMGAGIAAAEFMNEPDLAATNGAPKEYDAAAYGRDFSIFRDFIRQSSPETLIAGPGTISETSSDARSGMTARQLLAASAASLDVLSYHHYQTLSQRCGGRQDPDSMVREDWLARTDRSLALYRELRDAFAPGKPIWLTETADAACGGSPWDATFVDSFRYLDQLGRLARGGVQIVMHNTLAGSDYGLLDEDSFRPRPNYWAALLWRRLMGTTVLDAGAPESGLHIYGHCQRGVSGGVSLLAINISRRQSRALDLPVASERYTLSATSLGDKIVRLNGRALALDRNDELPPLTGAATAAGRVSFAPRTITFLAIPAAANPACR